MDETVNTNGGGKGSLIGSIIVVIILIVGAIYLFSGRTEAPVVPDDGTATTTIDETGAADLEAAAGSIDLNEIDTTAGELENAINQ